MKILEDKYPKGTWKNQKSDGRYIDRYLYENLKILAEKIVNDMTFLGIVFSSTLEVGTGKSVLSTQIGETWQLLMKEVHGIDVPYSCENIVWRPDDLIERAYKLPKYSFILLDEWEDSHYWSKLALTLRKFFQKCRQLNLFMIIIIPNYFELPLKYAVSRSIFAIDVKFDGNFNRGNYDFYNFPAKRDLYIKGKKFHNYNVADPLFRGWFHDGYGVPETEYRRLKYEDMIKSDEEEKRPSEKEIIQKVAVKFYKRLSEIRFDPPTNKFPKPQQFVADTIEMSRQSVSRWFVNENEDKEPTGLCPMPMPIHYNNIPSNKNDSLGGEEKEGEQTNENNNLS